jgi:hypothetical protein
MPGLARRALLVGACALAMGAVALPASAFADTSPVSIAANGDFSQPDAGGGWGNWGSDIPGWHDSTGCGIEVWGRGFIVSAPGNAQALELDSNCSSSISQQLSTEPGQLYLVTYYFAARPGTDADDNGVEVKWNGASRQSEMTGDPTFKRYSFYVTADSAASTISFTDIGRSDGLGSVLARVAVTPVSAQGAPVVDVAAQNIVQSYYTPNPSASGSFFAGGPVKVTADHGDLGHVTDNGDGSWAWTFDHTSAGDPLPATVTVTATDASGAVASDSFTVMQSGISSDTACFDPSNDQIVNVTAYGFVPYSWYYPFVGFNPGPDDGWWAGWDWSDIGTDSSGSGAGSVYTSAGTYSGYHTWYGVGDGYSVYLKLGSYNDYSVVAQKRIPVCGADTVAPTVSAPADQTAEATGPGGATVSYLAPTATDNDPNGQLDPSCSPASGSQFPLGTTTVSCSAADLAGNSGSASFKVTVQDTTPPRISSVGDISTEATGPNGAAAGYTPPTATDAVDGSVQPDCSSASGSTFPLGTTSVTCTATDRAGNKATSSFQVKVVDTTPPTVHVPADMTAEATGASGAPAQFNATAEDLADGSDPVSCSNKSGDTFALGTTTITCSATDKAGNKATGSFKIKVVDTTPPRLTLPADFAVDATSTSGAAVSFTASASDVVSGPEPVSCQVASTAGPSPVTSGKVLPIGTTRVTCSATDPAGNTATGGFSVLVRSAAQQAANLNNVLASFGLDPTTTTAISSKISAVIAAIPPAGQAASPSACNSLTPLNNQINAKTGTQPGKLFTTAQASQLLSVTKNIGVLMGC